MGTDVLGKIPVNSDVWIYYSIESVRWEAKE